MGIRKALRLWVSVVLVETLHIIHKTNAQRPGTAGVRPRAELQRVRTRAVLTDELTPVHTCLVWSLVVPPTATRQRDWTAVRSELKSYLWDPQVQPSQPHVPDSGPPRRAQRSLLLGFGFARSVEACTVYTPACKPVRSKQVVHRESRLRPLLVTLRTVYFIP